MENEENIYRCDCCETIVENEEDLIQVRGGDLVCESCLDYDYTYCEDCSEYIPNDECVTIFRDGYNRDCFYVCDRCASSYYQDEDTDEYYEDGDCGCSTHDGRWISQHTYEEYYGCCDDCGEVYHCDDFQEGEDGNYYCENCIDDHQEEEEPLIYNYHGFNNWQLYKCNYEEDVPYYIGFELEIDSDGGINEDLKTVHDLITSHINSVLMHDGSLSSRGIEIISHPQSFDYIMEQRGIYNDLFTRLREIGYTSHDNGRCGLHFHVTRPQNEEVIDRVELLLENFKSEITTFSRRNSSQLSQWSQFITDYCRGKEEDIKSLYFIQKNKSRLNGTRYHALNTTNRSTIEFRFCRGTLNTETFFASVQLIDNIMKIASDLSIKIDTVNWLDLINGDDCYNYCVSKNLTSSHIAEDNTQKILKKIELLHIKKDKLKDIINKYEKYAINDFNHKLVKIKSLEDTNILFTILNTFEDIKSNIKYVKRYIEAFENNRDNLDYVRELIDGADYLTRGNVSEYYKMRFNTIKKEMRDLCV